MQDLKEVVSARKEKERREKTAKAQQTLLELDAKEIVKTASGRRLMKAFFHLSPSELKFVTDPYKDAFMLGRIALCAELKTFFTEDDLRRIEGEPDVR